MLQEAVFAEGIFGDAVSGRLAEEAGDVFAEDVAFEVERVAGMAVAEAGGVEGVGDEVDLEPVVAEAADGEAHAVNGDGAFHHGLPREGLGTGHAPHDVAPAVAGVEEAAGLVNVAAHDVAAEAVAHGKRTFKVEARALAGVAERGALECLVEDFRREPAVADGGGGEARALHGDALAEGERVGPWLVRDGQCPSAVRVGEAFEGSDFLYKACEHEEKFLVAGF